MLMLISNYSITANATPRNPCGVFSYLDTFIQPRTGGWIKLLKLKVTNPAGPKPSRTERALEYRMESRTKELTCTDMV